MESDVACGAHALGLSCVGGERIGVGQSLRRMQDLAHATIAIVGALRRSAMDVCRRRSFHLCSDCSLSMDAVPQMARTNAKHHDNRTTTERQLQSTDRRLPATATRTPAAKLSTPRKPTSQWPSNRLLAYVLPLDPWGCRELETDDWDRCSAARSCSTSPLLWVRPQSHASFQSLWQLLGSFGRCARGRRAPG